MTNITVKAVKVGLKKPMLQQLPNSLLNRGTCNFSQPNQFMKLHLPPFKVIVFGLIGVFNTLFDLALYAVLYNFTHSIVIANVAATSAALIGSYLLNAKLTFKSKAWTPKVFVQFVAVTVFGLWVLQTVVIYLLQPFVADLPAYLFTWLGGFASLARTLLPKVLATGVTLVWNYLWYSRVVFKHRDQPDALL